jgi:hypothetical protein
MMGAATPTVWPLYGCTDATVAAVADGAIAATLVGAVPTIVATAIPAAASARRSAFAIVVFNSLLVISPQQKTV